MHRRKLKMPAGARHHTALLLAQPVDDDAEPPTRMQVDHPCGLAFAPTTVTLDDPVAAVFDATGLLGTTPSYDTIIVALAHSRVNDMTTPRSSPPPLPAFRAVTLLLDTHTVASPRVLPIVPRVVISVGIRLEPTTVTDALPVAITLLALIALMEWSVVMATVIDATPTTAVSATVVEATCPA